MSKDYIAQWYEVREEQGIPDRIQCFLYDRIEQQTEWFNFRHRDMDGIGMLNNNWATPPLSCRNAVIPRNQVSGRH